HSVWHSRLGHPASSTLQFLFSHNKLPLSGSQSVFFFFFFFFLVSHVHWLKVLSYPLVRLFLFLLHRLNLFTLVTSQDRLHLLQINQFLVFLIMFSSLMIFPVILGFTQ
ncbi:unnamed protein product, partial [Prunus brigantina]